MKKQSQQKRTRKVRGVIDLSEWILPSIDVATKTLERAALSAAAEAIDLALDNPDTTLDFALPYDKNADPLTLHLNICDFATNTKPFTKDTYGVYAFDLRESLSNSLIESCREDGSYTEDLIRISRELKSFAEEIDAVIARAKTHI